MPKPLPIPAALLKKLEGSAIKFLPLEHRTVYTAYDAAATLKRKEDEIAKALLIQAGKFRAVVLLSANRRLDTKKLSLVIVKQFNEKKASVSIPHERVLIKLTGSPKKPLSAFGSLYKLPVIIDHGLTKLRKAVFPGGSFNASLELALSDFIRFESAVVGKFSEAKPKIKKKAAKKKTVVKKKATKKAVKKTKSRKR